MAQARRTDTLKVKEAIMTKKGKHKLTLDRPATYQIKVQGKLDENWPDWAGELTVTVETNSLSITTLTGHLDQAALLGLLRRFYSLGIPLISVFCLDFV
jgi:hypothetical protein